MNTLIEAIKQKQLTHKISDRKLAKILGIDPSTWSKIKSGQRNPGMKFIRAVNEKLMPVEISDIIATPPPETSQNRFLALLETFGEFLYALYLKAREKIR